MSRRHVFAPVLAAAVLLALGIRSPGAAPRLRCDPTARLDASPRVVAANGTVHVRIDFGYRCPEARPQVHALILVENTEPLQPSGFAGRAQIGNVREGLVNFVEALDFGNGTQGGLLLYGNAVSVRTPLGGGSGGRQELITAVENFATAGGRQATAAGEAVTKATELLSAVDAAPGATKLMLIVDAGAPQGDAEALTAACGAARSAGLSVAVMALSTAGDRMKGCADDNLFRATSSEFAREVPETLGTLGYGVANSNQVATALVGGRLAAGFDYVAGSGRPREPDVRFGRELGWEFSPPPPAEGHVVELDVAVDPGLVNEVGPLAEVASLVLNYADGSAGELPIPVPEVCVHAPERRAFCDPFLATLTPRAATPTATLTQIHPSLTPTPTEAVETPVPTPQPTATEPIRGPVYLPIARRGG
jgi:hypothetical protein